MTNQEIANKYRREKGYIGRGGFIIIFNGIVIAETDNLRVALPFVPGCIAIDECGNEWVTAGGDDDRGADRWEPRTLSPI